MQIDVDSINNITGRVSTNDILKLVKLINEVKVSDALDVANEILNKGKEVSTLIQAMLSICCEWHEHFHNHPSAHTSDTLLRVW